jgi:N-hydroxyarylamine O-acetyltransferase
MDVDAYLDRLGLDRPARADVDSLRELHERHLTTVPFENLDVHLGERIEFTEDALFDKIVRRRRGGVCYELNAAFALLLRELGFEVSLLAAKPYDEGRGFGWPFEHLALRVDLGEPWLADIGVGRFIRHPLRMNARGVQHDPEGEFRVVDAADGDLDVIQNGTLKFRLETRARQLSEFTPTWWWHSTSPDSFIGKQPLCAITTPNGRVVLMGDRLIETVGGERVERILDDDREILEVYRTRFGVSLDRLPARDR